MSSRRSARQLLVAVILGVLVGGGLMAVTPAGAEVSSAVATNWKKIWKKNLKPLADKRYYTKAQSDAKYSTKADTAASAAAANAATDTKLGGYYKKAEIDAKLAPLVNSVSATAAGDQSIDLTAADVVVRSVSLMPPANGTVIATGSGYSGAGGVEGGTRCSLTTGTNVDYSFLQLARVPANGYSVVAGTRGFPVTKGVLLTINYVCNESLGNTDMDDSSITAIFAPS